MIEQNRLVKSKKRVRVRTYKIAPESPDLIGSTTTSNKSGKGIEVMSRQFAINPELDFSIEVAHVMSMK